jgi:hypothetical protein
MRAVILVPYRPTSPRRERLLHYLLPLLKTAGLPVYLADSGTEPFSSARSFNCAAVQAGQWDYALLNEADTYVDPGDILDALQLALDSPGAGIVYAYDHELRLNELGTVAFLGGKRASFTPQEIARQSPPAPMASHGGPRFISRSTWDAIGGFDERFVGWGPEDRALAWAAAATVGPPARLSATMLNLWHERRRRGAYWERAAINAELWHRIEIGAEPYAGATSIRD